MRQLTTVMGRLADDLTRARFGVRTSNPVNAPTNTLPSRPSSRSSIWFSLKNSTLSFYVMDFNGCMAESMPVEHYVTQDQNEHQQGQTHHRPLPQYAFHPFQSPAQRTTTRMDGLTHDHDVAFRYPRQISSPAPESGAPVRRRSKWP